MNTLSIQRPLPSIDIRTSAAVSTSVNRGEVNWPPWSLLKIPGLPNRASASSSAAMQKSTSMVFDNRQLRTRRVAQSITATRYRNPRRIGIYVMSAHQTWFGRSTTRLRSKYG
jgi:hypothetical protein